MIDDKYNYHVMFLILINCQTEGTKLDSTQTLIIEDYIDHYPCTFIYVLPYVCGWYI